MANQPPPRASFSGHPNFTQQWPLPFPSMIPPNLTSSSESQAAAPSPLVHPSQAFEFNMASANANANPRIPIPGNPGDRGVLFPPTFPFMGPLDVSQFPTSFPPMPMPPLGFAPIAAPPASSNIPLGSQQPQRAVPTTNSKSQASDQDAMESSDSNREEGEVSEGDGAQSINMKTSPKTGAGHALAAQRPSLGDGERVSSPSSSSTRSSSPYNPPLSISADEDVVNRAIELQRQDARISTSDSPQASRSAAQLRVQAQGALLSLAPHNIRYHELVAEGINPDVLKKLYEEVGIKVATRQPTQPAVEARSEKASNDEPAIQSQSRKPSVKHDKSGARQPSTLRTAPSDSGKPMERKELIAKMLAAKAAKPSEAATPKTLPEAQPVVTVPSPSITPSGEKTKDNGTPAREKSKAQTELARQRIEALKKQALLKIQQRNAQELSQPSPEDKPPAASAHSAPAVHHPLPVRPPAPQPLGTTSIPGLSLTDSSPSAESPTPSGVPAGIAVDSTPLTRANQRKRPRASDFDETDTIQKKYLPATASSSSHDPDKLIIHISDDESLYGDDEGEDMELDSSSNQDSAPVIMGMPLEASRPSLQKSVSDTRASTSTPQTSGRVSDQEKMRQKNLEIQALHRRIAEMEERRKAKLAASRTQSPLYPEDSTASLSVSASSAVPTEPLVSPTSPSAIDNKDFKTPSAIPAFCPKEIDSFSPSSLKILASIDRLQLTKLTGKLLRIVQAEKSLPVTDAGTLQSDPRLASYLEEADNLLVNLTDSKEERLQLLAELKNSGREPSGLSLAKMDELRRHAQSKQQRLASGEASTLPRPVAVTNESGVPEMPALSPSKEATDTPASHLSKSEFYTEEPPTVNTGNSSAELVARSQPARADSVMDQSDDETTSDDSSSGDESTSEESSCEGSSSEESSGGVSSMDESSLSGEEMHTSGAEGIAEPVQVGEEEQIQVDSLGHPPSDPPPFSSTANIQTITEGEDDNYEPTDNNGLEGDVHDDESSSDSEAYEPPEPEARADSPHSAYSPPPPALAEDAQGPLHHTSHSDRQLTAAPQVSFLEAQPVFQGSDSQILGVKSSSKIPVPKFTPYVSPLRYFRAYRYHPHYTEEVSDGYRSLTFSHDIDPMKHLCPYELAGGVCNDRSCDFQHFRDMSLSDDKILIQMGSVREGKTEEEKETYLAGLREIINEMRRDKVKDFNTVASEIAAYRRRFLSDPSRVLPL